MDNLQQPQNTTEGQAATLNGVSGKWIPVSPNEAPANVSSDPLRPTVGKDGAFYYAQNVDAGAMYPTPIGANLNNAIPTPSPIVQLPPIVQPIAMVPYTTQNQPLVQYDPNYRPPMEKTATPEPVYRRKPFIGISIAVAVLALVLIVVGSVFSVFNDNTIFSAIRVLVNGGSEGLSVFSIVVIALYIAIAVMALIIAINAIVRIGQMQPLKRFAVLTLITLLLAIIALVVMLINSNDFKVGIGAYLILVVLVAMMIVPLFINNKAQILDYIGSKETFVIK